MIEITGWGKLISRVLKAANNIVEQILLKNTNVLVHCSDGWDRTAQMSALSQQMLDPYYRTVEGFLVLLCKDWLSFGH